MQATATALTLPRYQKVLGHSSPYVSSRVALSAAGVALALHFYLGYQHGWSYQSTSLSSLVDAVNNSWFPVQSIVIAALALVAFPSAISKSSVSVKPGQVTGSTPSQSLREAFLRHFQSHYISISKRNGVAAQSRKPGLLRRLVKRVFLGPKPKAAAAVEVPFSRRRSFAGSGRSSKGSMDQGRSLSALDAARHGARQRMRHMLGKLSRWRPALLRVLSGQHLVAKLQRRSSAAGVASSISSSSATVMASNPFPYNGHLAADCLGDHNIDAGNSTGVNEVISDNHLLQFGAILDESSAELALSQRAVAGPVGSPDASLFGVSDDPAKYAQGWEPLIEEHKQGLHYWVWRRPLRKGLFMYRSRTVYERTTTQQVVNFTFNCVARTSWDDTLAELRPLPAPGQQLPASPQQHADLDAQANHSSAFLYARSKFPPPMAQREYIYARRIWRKADDGGCYCVSRSCGHPAAPQAPCRVVRVNDYTAGFVIRATPGIYERESAVEVVTVYFEDSKVNAGICNIGVRKGLWPMAQKTEQGLRRFVESHQAEAPAVNHLAVAAAAATAAVAGKAGDPAGGLDGGLQLLDSSSAPAEQDSLSSFAPELNSGRDRASDYPLSTHMCLSPLMYQVYLAAWRYAAAACMLLVRCHRELCRLLHAGFSAAYWPQASALRQAQACIAALAVPLRAGRGSNRTQHGGKSPLTSHPIQPSVSSDGSCGSNDAPSSEQHSDLTQRSSSSSSTDLRPACNEGAAAAQARGSRAGRRQGGRRWVGRLAAVAVRAVGLPLVHQVLSRSNALQAAAAENQLMEPAAVHRALTHSASSHGRHSTLASSSSASSVSSYSYKLGHRAPVEVDDPLTDYLEMRYRQLGRRVIL